MALKSLAKGQLNVSVLDAVAITVSLIRGDFETASSVMFLLKIGEILEEWTHKKSVSDLANTMSLGIEKVWLKNKNDENFTFKELLKYAMYRELSEESYIFINKDNTNNLNLNVTNFKVLGFARLASKAGKPDFFGKVQIKLNSVEEI